MSKKTIEEINAELQQELIPENEGYYGNLLIYVRTHSLIRNKQRSEELLLEILQDILEAQNQGVSAEDYFGKNPKQTADEIINQLPINLIDTVKMALTGLMVYLLIMFFPAMIDPDKGIDVGSYLICGLLAVAFAFFILKVFGHSVYRYQSKASSISLYLIIFAGLVCEILFVAFLSTPWVIFFSRTTGILLILFVTLFLISVFIREKDKAPWIPFIPLLAFYMIGGILLRINAFSHFLTTETGQLVLAGSLTVGLLVQALLLFVLNRKKSM